jgi:hypothetical protein
MRSRMREMFNLISFPNDSPDKRKWLNFLSPWGETQRGDIYSRALLPWQ